MKGTEEFFCSVHTSKFFLALKADVNQLGIIVYCFPTKVPIFCSTCSSICLSVELWWNYSLSLSLSLAALPEFIKSWSVYLFKLNYNWPHPPLIRSAFHKYCLFPFTNTGSCCCCSSAPSAQFVNLTTSLKSLKDLRVSLACYFRRKCREWMRLRFFKSASFQRHNEQISKGRKSLRVWSC